MAIRSGYNYIDTVVSHAFFGILDSVGVNLTATSSTEHLPTVESPTPVLLAICVYVGFVTLALQYIKARDLKPRLHEPLFLQSIVIFHNCFCLGLSLYMCFGIAHRCYQLKYSLWENPYDENETTLAIYIYIFYMSKFVEFMDTVVMLLKRNIRQVTFLHVYHHVSIALIWWMIAHHAPGGDAYFSAAINSGVHVIMYFYYLLSAVLRNCVKRRKYLFWGKYLTQLQMLQFFFNMIQAYYCVKVNAPYPQFLCKILLYYMISLLFLFANFYTRKYADSKNYHAKMT